MEKARISRKFFYAGFLLAVVLGYSLALGESLKKTVIIAKDVDGREVMQTAVGEGRALNYRPKREEDKVVLTKKMPSRSTIGGEKIYQITLSVAPGDEGRKLLTLEGEYIGDVRDREIKACFECDIDRIEKAVKNKLEGKP